MHMCMCSQVCCHGATPPALCVSKYGFVQVSTVPWGTAGQELWPTVGHRMCMLEPGWYTLLPTKPSLQTLEKPLQTISITEDN